MDPISKYFSHVMNTLEHTVQEWVPKSGETTKRVAQIAYDLRVNRYVLSTALGAILRSVPMEPEIEAEVRTFKRNLDVRHRVPKPWGFGLKRGRPRKNPAHGSFGENTLGSKRRRKGMDSSDAGGDQG